MQCTVCKNEIPDEVKFCNHCGVEVKNQGQTCPNCKKKDLPRQALYCPNCGYELKPKGKVIQVKITDLVTFNENVQGLTFTMHAIKGKINTQVNQPSSRETGSAQTAALNSFYIGDFVTCKMFKAFVNDTGYLTDAEILGRSIISKEGEAIEKTNVNFRCGIDGAIRTDENNESKALFLSWNDASAFCRWLQKKTGKSYRLPTEAELKHYDSIQTKNDNIFNKQNPVGGALSGLFTIGSALANWIKDECQWCLDCFEKENSGQQLPKDSKDSFISSTATFKVVYSPSSRKPAAPTYSSYKISFRVALSV